MATGETEFQNEIIKEVKNQKGNAYKASNAILNGIADLDIQLPGCLNLKSEFKFFNCNESFGFKTVKPTLAQTVFLSDNIEAGGKSSVWVGYKIVHSRTARVIWGCAIFSPIIYNPKTNFEGYRLERSKIENGNDNYFNTFKGEPWPVRRMVERSIRISPIQIIGSQVA